MQYLYTLTSTENDYFYEQFLLSATSLKIQIPDAQIILLCDTKTIETLAEKRQNHLKLIAKIISVETPARFNQIEISRWVRTSMRRLVKGDFLFLDGDTVVTDDLSAIFQTHTNFSACLDKHSLIDIHSKKTSIITKNKLLGFDSHITNHHYNGGVLFCPDTPETHKIFDRWHELWLYSRKKNIIRDQPSLNMAIYENQSCFSELDGTWNCQIAYNGLPYLSCSRIIHYFATDLTFNQSSFLLANEEIFKSIKNTGEIPNEALILLKNPRSAFSKQSQIISGDDMLFVLNSNIFQFNFLLRKKMPFLFIFFNFLFGLLKGIVKFFVIRFYNKKDLGRYIYN